MVVEACIHTTFWNKNPNQNRTSSGRASYMSHDDEESRRMATRSGRNNSGASSSSSSSAPTALRVVASTVTEPTLNMPTTPVQLTEMIASAVRQHWRINNLSTEIHSTPQPVDRSAMHLLGRKMKILEVIFLDQQLMKFLRIYTGKHHQLPTRLSSGVACQTPTRVIISGRPQY